MTKRLFAKAGLSLERLRTFAEVVAAAGISNAAPGDPNRQSQFSRQLKELEEFFGTELLKRSKGRFELTASGRELFAIVHSHFNAMEDFADRCVKHNVDVTVGAGESILSWLLLPEFGAFHTAVDGVTLVLRNLRTEEIGSALVGGDIDIGILRQDAVRPPLKAAPLGLIRYCIAFPRKAQEATATSVWHALKALSIGILSGSEVAEAVEHEAARRKVPLDVTIRASSYAQLIQAFRQTRCAIVLPNFATAELAGEAVMIGVPALKKFSRTLALAWNPRVSVLRPRVDNAIQSLEKLLRQRLLT